MQSGQNRKILIIEDDPGHSKLLEYMVKKEGYTCDCVPDGKEGIHEAYNNDYALMFVDIHTPKVDGFIVVNSLRERGIKTPMIAVTALTLDGVDEISITAGYDEFLRKPISQEDVQRIIKKYIPTDTPETV